jgi:hypothetical protein|tara:strand:+ start:194 stop:352 length:159 start_codon:yes stop_codon:yes gene_type:complete
MAGYRTSEVSILMLERILEVGLYSLAWAMGIGGFIFGAMWAIYTIMQDNYEK